MAKKNAHIEVVWTNIAENQLKGIVDYWIDNNQSSSYSEQLIEDPQSHPWPLQHFISEVQKSTCDFSDLG